MTAETVHVGCIRTWYSTWTSCKCPPCRADRYRQRKRSDAGLHRRTPSEDAWAALDQMITAGWTGAAIASASGLTDRCLQSIIKEMRDGHRRRFGATIAAMIVNHGEPTRGYVGAVAARRKVRALAVMGYRQTDIAEAAGMRERWTTIAAIQRGDTTRISPRTAAAIDQAWRVLTRTPGGNQKASARAATERWAGVGAWADIDDPNETPGDAADGPSAARRTAHKAVELAALGLGVNEIAQRLGIQADSVARSLYRARMKTGNGDAA